MSSVVSQSKQRYRKQKAQKTLIRASLLALFGFLALGAVLFASYFRVTIVSVSGAETVQPEDVQGTVKDIISKKLAFIIPRENFFLIPSEAIRTEVLREYPRLRDASVARSFPNTLRISVAERRILGVWCMALPESASAASLENLAHYYAAEAAKEESCFFIDETGVIFERSPLFGGTIVLKIKSRHAHLPEPGDRVLDSELLGRMALFREEFERAFDLPVKEFLVAGERNNEIVAFTAEGWWIRFDPNVNIASAVENVKLVLAKEVPRRDRLEYADVRFENKVFYKLKE